MGNVKDATQKIFKAAISTFKTFPAANGCALGFTLVTMVRIQLDWPQQEAYNFLFNCLHLSLALGTVMSLAAIAGVQTFLQKPSALRLANGFGVLSAVAAFAGLYFFGADQSREALQSFNHVSEIASARVLVAIAIGFLALMLISAQPKNRSSLPKALFMLEKAFFIALIYGGVMMAGATGVAGAVHTLLFNDMSEKVYMYIGAMVGFLAFTVFAGCLPDFSHQTEDVHWETAQKQPRFIEILFLNIMVPLMAAMTVVLLAWTGKILVTQDWPPFAQLSSIAVAYAVIGIWLHYMVADQETNMALLYKQFYPVAALLVLAFEAWALFVQLQAYGVKTAEYYFVLVWLVSVAASVLLLIRKASAYQTITYLISGALLMSILPYVGYHVLPVQQQVHRLEVLLEDNNMLVDGALVPAKTVPSDLERAYMTDAVYFLAYARDAKLPGWFDKNLSDSTVFKTKMGFDQTWENGQGQVYAPNQLLSVVLQLPNEALSIRGYDWVVNPQTLKQFGDSSAAEIHGAKGTYKLDWMSSGGKVPTLKLEKDGKVILEQSMKPYLDKLVEKYPLGANRETSPTTADMTLKFAVPEAEVLIVFQSINIDLDPSRDSTNYWMNLSGIYLKEK